MSNHHILHNQAASYFKGNRGLTETEEIEVLKNIKLWAESRRKAGRYTLEEAAIYVGTHAAARISRVYRRLQNAVTDGVLKIYRQGEDISCDIKEEFVNYPWKDEILWNDLNNWLEENAPLIGRIFPTPIQLQTLGESKPAISPAPVTRKNKLRRNSIDPAIDKAIERAGNQKLADVYLQLKELALSELKPFTGHLDGSALCYTDDNGKAAKLSKDALRQRLKSRG